MSRRRYLSTEAGRDKALRDLARVSLFAHSLYLLSIPAAGDDARLPSNDPDELMAEVWPQMMRDYGTGQVEEAIALLVGNGLWEYGPDGELRFPPASFYKYQTYIRDKRRISAPEPEDDPNQQRTTAQASINREAAAHNSALPRTSAQNTASRAPAPFSFSSSSSPSVPVSVSPPTPSATEGEAPDADAPDAPQRPSTALVLLPSAPAPKPSRNGAHPFSDLWEAFDQVLGEVSAPMEKTRRAKACKELREGHYSAADLMTAAEAWPNVMSDATLSEMGLVANMGKLLRGPQRNGRSAGLVQQHTQRLSETAVLTRRPTVGDLRRQRGAN